MHLHLSAPSAVGQPDPVQSSYALTYVINISVVDQGKLIYQTCPDTEVAGRKLFNRYYHNLCANVKFLLQVRTVLLAGVKIRVTSGPRTWQSCYAHCTRLQRFLSDIFELRIADEEQLCGGEVGRLLDCRMLALDRVQVRGQVMQSIS